MADAQGSIAAFVKALEEAGYNAKPGKLRNGCMTLVRADGLPATEDDYDRAWAQVEREHQARFVDVEDFRGQG